MGFPNKISRFCLIAAAALAFAGHAEAQDIASMNRNFDQQFNQRLSGLQQQNAASMQQLWQYHLRVNGPRLQQQYRQYLASGNRGISYEQFAYYDMMTAAGTNVAGGMDAQRRQFEGNQAANRTVQSGYQSYNAGWAQNSQRYSDTAARYSEQAIRGNAPYIDPRTGARQMLPYSPPAGQVYNVGGVPHVQDQSGAYYRWAGNSWERLQPGR
jgi:hypothetical protein